MLNGSWNVPSQPEIVGVSGSVSGTIPAAPLTGSCGVDPGLERNHGEF